MDKKYLKFQTKRLELLKIITSLYSLNPVIALLKMILKKQMKIIIKPMKINEEDENSPLIMRNYTISPGLFQKIIVNHKHILEYLFSLYFIYCIKFLYLLCFELIEYIMQYHTVK